jgi:phospholipase D1/2
MNFEQRWRKASNVRFKRVASWHDDALIKIERISWIQSPAPSVFKDGTTSVPEDDRELWVSKENDPESWHVQV